MVNDKAKEFLNELAQLCKKHQVSIETNGEHGCGLHIVDARTGWEIGEEIHGVNSEGAWKSD